MEEQIKQLISKSDKILISSHINPDFDSVTSSLFMRDLIKTNFPDKEVKIYFQDTPPSAADFLTDFKEINIQDPAIALEHFNADLIIILDVYRTDRISRENFSTIDEKIKNKSLKSIVIDHHHNEDTSMFDIYYNDMDSSAVQAVYNIFIKKLGLKASNDFAKTVMLGTITDTGYFKHPGKKHRETFDLVSELIDLGANIEELHNKISRIEPEYILIIKELFKNFTINEKFTYSFLDMNFVDQNKIREFEGQIYSGAYHIFTDAYITKVKDRDFGFVILPDLASNESSKYRCSFRSISTGVDTTVFTRKFGGGGHKAVSGCTVEASSVSEALDKVFKVIDENYEEALKDL